MAAVRAPTMSIEYVAHFHVQVEDWKDRDEIVPKTHRLEQWNDSREKGTESAANIHKFQEHAVVVHAWENASM